MLGGVMFKLVSVAASGLVAIGLGLSGCAALDQSKPSAQSDTASATKELQIRPILQTTTGLSGKSFAYPEGERLNCACCAWNFPSAAVFPCTPTLRL